VTQDDLVGLVVLVALVCVAVAAMVRASGTRKREGWRVALKESCAVRGLRSAEVVGTRVRPITLRVGDPVDAAWLQSPAGYAAIRAVLGIDVGIANGRGSTVLVGVSVPDPSAKPS
jgi:hypothetical protein